MGQNSDPMGFQNAGMASGAYEALRQMIADRLAEQQRSREQFTQDRDFALKKQEADQRAEEHRFTIQSLMDQRTAATAENRDKMLTATTGRLSIGQTMPESGPTASMLPDYLKQNTPMTAPAPPDALLAPGDQGGAQPMPGTIANSAAPAQRTVSYTGTDKQKTEEQQKAGQLRLLNDPTISPRERLAIQMENSGLKVPAGVFDPKPAATNDGSYMLNGKPIVGLKTNGRVMYQGQDVTDKVTPYTAPVHEPNPQPQMFTGPDGKLHAVQFVGGAAREIPLPTDYTKPNATLQVEATHKKEALGVLDQLDQAVDNARDLVGPGAGRFTSLEQMAGAADPRAQALGTKMLLAKMKIDAGMGGMRAAASPQILARWDNLLANKVTPEGLKAAVQAAREILGGASVSPSSSKIKSITEIK